MTYQIVPLTTYQIVPLMTYQIVPLPTYQIVPLHTMVDVSHDFLQFFFSFVSPVLAVGCGHTVLQCLSLTFIHCALTATHK